LEASFGDGKFPISAGIITITGGGRVSIRGSLARFSSTFYGKIDGVNATGEFSLTTSIQRSGDRLLLHDRYR
jgi:hypothetical protein